MRALGFEAKKTDVLKILKDYDHQSTGKIVFSDFQDVSECSHACFGLGAGSYLSV